MAQAFAVTVCIAAEATVNDEPAANDEPSLDDKPTVDGEHVSSTHAEQAPPNHAHQGLIHHLSPCCYLV